MCGVQSPAQDPTADEGRAEKDQIESSHRTVVLRVLGLLT